MRKVTVFFIVLVAVIACGSGVEAALEFDADFDQDDIYEISWTMKADDVVSVDIYVSNVPAPGLVSMGFKLTYDSSKLEVVTGSTTVDITNWPSGGSPYVEFINAEGDIDEIEMSGFRTGVSLAGDNILLGTVTFQCISEGTSEFMLLDREEDWFVLEDYTILDGDIGAGVLLATITDSFDLTVTKSGTGKGTVASAPSGINCGTDCTEPFVSGTTVVLTATPSQDSSFVKWTGCDAVNNKTCTVYMTGDRTVTAEFEEDFPWVIFYPAFIKKKDK
jgi:List-Bact-rpt repeat protein/cohesin domain-containing protein